MTTEQTAENHVFELEVRVRAAGQKDAVINREYVSTEKSSTDGAVKEIWDSVSAPTKAKMRGVADGD